MGLAKKIVAVVLVMFCGACGDILEEPDISNSQVEVFAPLDNTVLTTNAVNFNWDVVLDARSYRVQVAQPDFENTQQLVLDSVIALDSLGNVPTTVQQTLLNGNYAWRVKAINGGFETAYTTQNFQVDGDPEVDTTPPSTPNLTAPANGTNQSAAVVDFSWNREDVSGTAERDSIFFFSDEERNTRIGADLGANKTFRASFEPGTYFWTVQAFDAAGNESAASEAFSFTIN